MDIVSIRIVTISLALIAILCLGSIAYLESIGRAAPASLVCALQVSIGCLSGIMVPTRLRDRDREQQRFEVAAPAPPPPKIGQ